ncbi:MAG: hypothetical protein OEY41_13590 [Acidimicrobiia bacterium]|nr:hypothetical protein [Acidimicrobiia bacterium]MDH5291023.1 hypothetical protein [Acidimicrobiia bacterium]
MSQLGERVLGPLHPDLSVAASRALRLRGPAAGRGGMCGTT